MIKELKLYYFQTDKLGPKYHPVKGLSFEDAVAQASVVINIFTDYTLFNMEEKVFVTNGELEKRYYVHCEPDCFQNTNILETKYFMKLTVRGGGAD